MNRDFMRSPHNMLEYRADEQVAVLEDGSEWAVYSGFAAIVQQWNSDQMIMLKASKDKEYPYKLVNVHLQESVEARPLNSSPRGQD